EREHPAKPVHAALSHRLIELEDHLGVAPGSEAASLPDHLLPALVVVVDLAVQDEHRLPVVAHEGLRASFEIHDGETHVAEADSVAAIDPLAVGPAMGERAVHPAEDGLGIGSVRAEAAEAGYAAHGITIALECTCSTTNVSIRFPGGSSIYEGESQVGMKSSQRAPPRVAEETRTSPPWARAARRRMGSPRPKPSPPARASALRKKGSKTRSRSWLAIPGPPSST